MLIKTKRFILKKLRISDVNHNYLSWFSDKEVQKYILFKPTNLKTLKKDVSKKIKKKNSYFFGIYKNSNHIGNIFFDQINKKNKSAILGILIGAKKWRNKGVGHEVIQELIKWIKFKKKVNKIYLGVSKKNTNAIKLYKKIGFYKINQNRKNINMLFDNSITNKIVIGTAQFGSAYGITNVKNKQVKIPEIKKIYKYCKNENIHEIDTADDYKVDINLLPKLNKEIWKINTKIKLEDRFLNLNYLNNYLKKNFIKNKKSKINILYIHQDVDFKSNTFKKIFRNLKILKENKIINKIGISIYDFAKVKKLIQKYKIDALQVPFNVLDRRLEKYQKFFVKKKIEIYIRSVFLQGILITNIRFKKFSALQKKIKLISEKEKISKINLCINYADQNPSIKKIILGFQNLREIKEIFNKFYKTNIPILKSLHINSKKISDPRNW